MKRILRTLKTALRGEEKEFTSGSINRALVLLAIPMILEMLMESLFAVVDAFFVSRVGTNAVATIGLTESVITIVYSMAIGLEYGCDRNGSPTYRRKRPGGSSPGRSASHQSEYRRGHPPGHFWRRYFLPPISYVGWGPTKR